METLTNTEYGSSAKANDCLSAADGYEWFPEREDKRNGIMTFMETLIDTEYGSSARGINQKLFRVTRFEKLKS